MTNDMADIRYLFEPRSIAVIGASSNPKKIGYSILNNVLTGGFKGDVYPINPRGGGILGLPVYTSVKEVGKPVDVACINIPAEHVFESVKDCADHGVKHAFVITSGFSETGNIEEERRIVQYAHSKGMRILGPNIFGVYSAVAKLNSTFGPPNITEGHVAIITQSGALGLAMIGKTAVEQIGLSAIVSIGNKSDIDEADLLDYLVRQEQTRIIMMYIEGVKNGHKLVDRLKYATKHKPVVVIKSGRSKRGAMAAASHTGSLAGADEVFNDIMRQCGVLRAESIQDAFSWCKFLARVPEPRGENTVIVTNGGGIGVMATDACEKFGVTLYDNMPALKEIFGPATPDFGSTKNPVDITGQATPKEYNSALDAGRVHDDIDMVVGLYCETAVFDASSLRAMIVDNFRKYRDAGKPLIFSIFGGEVTEQAFNQLREDRVTVYPDVYEAISCVGALNRYHKHKIEQELPPVSAEIDVAAINAIIDVARKEDRHFLLAHESIKVMQAAGIGMPKSRVARTLEQAIGYAEEIGYPVVMKIVSKDIIHKSDAGGVALDLENKDEVIDAYQAVIRNARAYNAKAVIEGVEVVEMVTKGTEIIIGARKDRTFGPIVMVGMGGIYVEVLKDVSFRALPLDRREVLRMIKDIRSYQLLLGVRGEAQKDIDALVDTIIRLGSIITAIEPISDIEVNPVVVYENGEGVRAVDARILLSK